MEETKAGDSQSLRHSLPISARMTSRMLQDSTSPIDKALTILQRIKKRHLERHWHSLHIGSIDNKRCLQLKKQKDEYKMRRAIEHMNNMLKSRARMHQQVNKAKRFSQWKENVRELSLSLQQHFSQGSASSRGKN